jgi:hypothetical protein
VSSKGFPSKEEIDSYRQKAKEYLDLLSTLEDDSAFKNYEHILIAHACDVIEVVTDFELV